MTPHTWREFRETLETATLKFRPFAKPDSVRLSDKLHEKKITIKEAMKLHRRLKKAERL